MSNYLKFLLFIFVPYLVLIIIGVLYIPIFAIKVLLTLLFLDAIVCSIINTRMYYTGKESKNCDRRSFIRPWFIYNRVFPLGSYKAITIMRLVIVKDKRMKGCLQFMTENALEHLDSKEKIMVNHETIHYKQIMQTSHVLFYIIYGFEWLYNIIKYKGSRRMAYRYNCFEIEAYSNETDFSYLCKMDYAWMDWLFNTKYTDNK